MGDPHDVCQAICSCWALYPALVPDSGSGSFPALWDHRSSLALSRQADSADHVPSPSGGHVLTFNAIDVETANADRASICQIGIVHVRDGALVDQWRTLVNPEAWFDPWNVRIHGIREVDVTDSPTLPDVASDLRSRLDREAVVSHTAFDRVALQRALIRYSLDPLPATWLDSAAIARRAWPARYARRGYGLHSIASDLDIAFQHHDALEDARAAAHVVLRACEASNLDIAGWLERVRRPVLPASRSPSSLSVKRDPNPDGPLSGETVVFTGALGITRAEAADLAAAAGCAVGVGVTKKTTMLVVGIQDASKLKGYEKSGKHRKAELLVERGAAIQILSEADFHDLVTVRTS